MNNILMFVTTFLIQLIIAVEMAVIGPLAPYLAKYFLIKENMVILFNLGYSIVGFFVPYLGIFADKFGKKKSLVISLIMFILGSVCAGLAKSPYIFALARMLIGFAYFSLSGTTLSYLSEFISYKNRGKASGLLRIAFGIAILFTPIFATYLVSKYNSLTIIYFPLAIIGGFALTFLTKLPETKKSQNVKLDKREFLSLLKNPLAEKMLLTVFLLLTAPSLILNYLGIYLANSFSLSQVNIGIAYTIVAIGTVTGIVFSTIFSDRLGKYKLSKYFFIIMAIGTFPMFYSNSLPIVIGLVTIFSFGLDGGWTSYQALASEVIPEKRGTFMSLFYTVNAITIVFYSLVGPIIYGLGKFKLVLTISTLSSILAITLISTLKINE